MSSYVVTGLAFGDEGKGSWVDHLCRLHNIKTVVRFNGGAQALHHVTTEDGVTHGFSQFGSHTFIPGAKTLLSRFMLIEPLAMLKEAEQLQQKGVWSPLRSLFISEQAPIIPYSNVLLNRAMEASRADNRHGSCGLGIGVTQRDVEELGEAALRAGDLSLSTEFLVEKVSHLVDRAQTEVVSWESASSAVYTNELRAFDVPKYVELLQGFAKRVRIIPEQAFLSLIRRERCVFEGAQGALLDQYEGYFPHCTRSTTTPKNALDLLNDAGSSQQVYRYGLLRAYSTRHGAGPFVTESDITVPLCDNSTGEWQGAFRHGWFDAVAARHALHFAAVDGVVLTNLDRLDGIGTLSVADSYRGMGTRFYDQRTESLRLVPHYDASVDRTNELFEALPQYQQLSGWYSEYDSAHEEYVRFLESEVKIPIVALSRRKDHQKIYR